MATFPSRNTFLAGLIFNGDMKALLDLIANMPEPE